MLLHFCVIFTGHKALTAHWNTSLTLLAAGLVLKTSYGTC